MKRFTFRLEALLDMRAKQEEKVKLTLAKKNNEIIEAQKKINLIHDEIKTLQNTEKKQRVVVSNPLLFRYSVSYRFKLKKDLTVAIKSMDDLKADAFRIQHELVEAVRKRRAVEIIKERRVQEWKREYQIREQNFSDEISQQSFIRKMHEQEKQTDTL